MPGRLGFVEVAFILAVGLVEGAVVVGMLLGINVTTLRLYPRSMRPAPMPPRRLLGVFAGTVLTFGCAALIAIFVDDTITTALLTVLVLLPLALFLYRARKPFPPPADDVDRRHRW